MKTIYDAVYVFENKEIWLPDLYNSDELFE